MEDYNLELLRNATRDVGRSLGRGEEEQIKRKMGFLVKSMRQRAHNRWQVPEELGGIILQISEDKRCAKFLPEDWRRIIISLLSSKLAKSKFPESDSIRDGFSGGTRKQKKKSTNDALIRRVPGSFESGKR